MDKSLRSWLACVAIVDPIVSGTYLADKLKAHGMYAIGIFTLTGLTEAEQALRFHPEDFDQAFYLADFVNLEALALALRACKIDFLLYGSEKSVLITDQLNALLQLPYANDPSSSAHRFDKYEMIKCIAKGDKTDIQQMKISGRHLRDEHFAQLATWRFPSVVKPINAGGSSGVKVVENVPDLMAYLQDAPEVYTGSHITEFVLQEQLFGDEYFVDALSVKGQHQVISVCRYHKRNVNGYAIYRYVERVNPDEFPEIVAYVFHVLSQVGLNNGLSHTEIFLTAEGPRLIEVNPRISGSYGMVNQLAELVCGMSQPKALADYLTQHQLVATLPPSSGFGRIVFLQNWEPRIIGALQCEKLRLLPSFVSVKGLKPAGSKLGLPQALSDTVALVLLFSSTLKKLEQDCERLFEWERQQQLF